MVGFLKAPWVILKCHGVSELLYRFGLHSVICKSVCVKEKKKPGIRLSRARGQWPTAWLLHTPDVAALVRDCCPHHPKTVSVPTGFSSSFQAGRKKGREKG